MKNRILSYLCLITLWIQVNAEGCSSSSMSSEDGCWYTFWYVWLAVGLFLAVLIAIIIVYCKHNSQKRTRVRRIGGARPLDPPAYAAPSHEPPAYDVAMKESIVVPVHFHGDIRHIRALQVRHQNERNMERAYYERQINRQVSDVSVISYPPSYVDDQLRVNNANNNINTVNTSTTNARTTNSNNTRNTNTNHTGPRNANTNQAGARITNTNNTNTNNTGARVTNTNNSNTRNTNTNRR